MPKYHAVMIDETGCEFGASVTTANDSAAREALREDYPESRIDELRTDEQQAQIQWEREQRAANDYWDPQHRWGDYDPEDDCE